MNMTRQFLDVIPGLYRAWSLAVTEKKIPKPQKVKPKIPDLQATAHVTWRHAAIH